MHGKTLRTISIPKQNGRRQSTSSWWIFSISRDNVQWDEEQEKNALDSVSKNSQVTLNAEERQKLEDQADQFWDAFYDIHDNKFFKDRHWLFTEFPELAACSTVNGESQDASIFEIGCGVGNTIMPITKYNIDTKLKIYGCDFSPKAINILENHAEFDRQRCKVFVLDATQPDWSNVVPFEEGSIDIIVLIFVLSAIHPDKWVWYWKAHYERGTK